MTALPPAVAQHIQANAPAMATGAIDYARLLGQELPPLDFYDTRAPLGAVPGSVLVHNIRVRAGALAAAGLGRGDRVVMVCASDEPYLVTLLAALLLGAAPCAVAPPLSPTREQSAGVQHLRAAVDVVNPKLVVAQSRNACAASHPHVVTYEDLATADAPGCSPDDFVRSPEPGDVHHIQLTSGSTSAPKAVLLTHGNVTHNVATLAHANGVVRGRESVFSWLPLYHDMGFIQVLGALLYGLRVGLMTPLGFLRDPLSWARHMTHHGSTHTAGAPFAYHATAKALEREGGRAAGTAAQIDLSALRNAYIGAEPIAYSTLRYFTESFAPLGLRPDALVPCYGMAESVVATTVALGKSTDGPSNFGRVRVLRSEQDQRCLVSCGPPIDGLRIRIVGSDGVSLTDGEVGDIQVSGPSIMGYQAPDGTVQQPHRGWHDTGDRGLLSEGELFVVGRSKEMLIVRGRNFPPYDVEQAVDQVPGVAGGQTVVFSVPDESRGRECVVAVIGTNAPEREHVRIRTIVGMAVRSAFGFSLDDIVLVRSGSVPSTTSGKLQRVKVRALYLDGRLS